jgi:5'-3' exonuclease
MIPLRILIIDGFNLFYANYHANTRQSQNGEPIGGFIGFLHQLRNIVYKFSPQQIIIVFDGPNAGYRRKLIFKEYKGKRAKKIRYARVGVGESKEEQIQINNEQEQLKKLIEFLKQLPIKIAIIPNFEADDVIAHIVIHNTEYENLIVSSDKDFLQLLDNNIFVYQPFKKILINKETIKEIYNIPKENFLFYRTICGDESDAFKGIPGINKKSLLKIFPEIKKTSFKSFEQFWDAIKNIQDDSKTAIKLKKGYENSLMTYKLMQLGTTLNLKAIESLQLQLKEQEEKTYSKLNLKIYCVRQGLNFEIQNFETWISPFNFLNNKLTLRV